MTAAGKAVFLSYAREDADAARRIAEALRASGVEVWFDAHELKGGDAWDQKIRGQIRECALFLPVISAQTQARAEGYFRREWKLADHRTEDMGRRRAFLVPVCIDETSDGDADVPDSFLKVQWTRLPGALPTPEFVRQVQRLLEPTREHEPAPGPRPSGSGSSSLSAKSSVSPFIFAGAMAVVAVSVATVFLVTRKPSAPATSAQPTPTTGPVPAVVAAKSIAVLPFKNMSTDQENAFFADGVHEDVLTNLSNIQELKVIARTSVMEYRDSPKQIPQIARELGVAYVLEGSVRRSGNTVRVVCQLIDGRTGQHVLAPPPFDRRLEDIFAIQSEIAAKIAAELKAVISPGEKATLERAPTDNLTAYDLFLRAREARNATFAPAARLAQTEPLLRSAVQYDPGFAMAWRLLGLTHLDAINARLPGSDTHRVQALAALERARQLEPANAATESALGNYYLDTGDTVRAAEQARRVQEMFPENAQTAWFLARYVRSEGRIVESLDYYRKAWALDPRNPELTRAVRTMLVSARRYDEAEALARATVGQDSNAFIGYLNVYVHFLARGSTREVEAFFAALPDAVRRSDPNIRVARVHWTFIRGDAAEVIRLWKESPRDVPFFSRRFDLLAVAMAHRARGEDAAARALLEQNRDRLLAELAEQPMNSVRWQDLVLTHAMLGDRASALAARTKLLETSRSTERTSDDVCLYAWLGDKDQALEALARSFRKGPNTPSSWTSGNWHNVHENRRSLALWPLHGDPRFEAILNDPANNAPLF